ncbi:hypothetical protein BDN70DRAFT_976815 [Pholiota conissans]|uniref:Uncharacterized protein n=1 Tax=Pholiota conissans TaxID=109636 RepID=A0A9P5Z4H0_9AGAR|nr:hypothetical protein BDN70DRAFT_976815 [Pholiota conissans]
MGPKQAKQVSLKTKFQQYNSRIGIIYTSMATTHYPKSTKGSAHLFEPELGSPANMLPTWTPMPNLEINSKRGLDSDSNDGSDTSEVDELDEDKIVIKTPTKRRKIAATFFTPPQTQNTKIAPSTTRLIKASSSKVTLALSTHAASEDDFQYPNPGEVLYVTPSENPNSTLLCSQEFGPTFNIMRLESAFNEQKDPFLVRLSTFDAGTRKDIAEGNVRGRNPFSSRTIFITDATVTVTGASTLTSESICPSKLSEERVFVEHQVQHHSKHAQLHVEPPKNARNKDVTVRTHEAGVDKLDVLTKARVSPVVFRRPRYAPQARNEDREAAMRYNLRWVIERVGKVHVEEQNENGKGKAHEVRPFALHELTQRQSCDRILEDVSMQEEIHGMETSSE